MRIRIKAGETISDTVVLTTEKQTVFLTIKEARWLATSLAFAADRAKRKQPFKEEIRI